MGKQNSYRLPPYVLSENPSLTENDLQEIEQILDFSASYHYPEAETEKQWQKFSAQIQTPLHVSKKPNRFAMFRWAAAAIVVLTLGIGFWQYTINQYPIYTASYHIQDQKQTLSLPDGSLLSMNAGTVLEVKCINPNKRILHLKQGEIFLNVKHSDVPFRVITSKGDITVLGTEFYVSDLDKNTFSVFLQKGKIRFETNEQQVILKPGQEIEAASNGDLVIGEVQNKNAYAWAQDKLVFDNIQLSEIIKSLETLYQVSFHYDAALANEKITITFDNLKAEQAAALLGKTINSPVSVKK